jgi:hypothetical protein
MKLFSFAAVMLASTIALAFPGVNDKATYLGKYTQKASGQSFMFMQYFEITAFDSAKQIYSVKKILDLPNGDSQEELSEVPANELSNREQMLEVVANCAAMGGVSENIKVAAGSFDTCKIVTENGNSSLWLGAVPFSVVKYSTVSPESGDVVEAELSLFEEGQAQ